MNNDAAPALINLPMGVGTMMIVPAAHVMLMDQIDMFQPVYGSVRMVEMVTVTGSDKVRRMRTRITVADGSRMTCDPRAAIKITRVVG